LRYRIYEGIVANQTIETSSDQCAFLLV